VAGADAQSKLVREEPMKSRQEIVEALRQARPQLAREFGVRRLALFGSYARGDQRDDSDVDVLVEVDPSIGLRFVDLAEQIETLLGVRADVVSRRAISPSHWALVEKELVDVA
jgi:predicted nucleotidyltransferase